jgi:hypothetical protein
MKKLLFLCLLMTSACSNSPQGNELGSGADLVVDSDGNKRLFEFTIPNLNVKDEEFPDTIDYPGASEDEYVLRDLFKAPKNKEKDFVILTLDRLHSMSEAITGNSNNNEFVSTVIEEMNRRVWRFNQKIKSAGDVWVASFASDDFKAVTTHLIPLANRNRMIVNFSPEFFLLKYEADKAGAILHELYGSVMDEKLRVGGADLTLFQKRLISLVTRTYTRQSFVPQPSPLGIAALFNYEIVPETERGLISTVENGKEQGKAGYN